MDLSLLFLAAFAAATILPLSSEALLAGLMVTRAQDPGLLLAVATAGNTLGGVANWIVGRMGARWAHHSRFRLNFARLERATRWFQRWGTPSLLLSWLPGIGDPLTMVAGFLGTPFLQFVLLVAAGKALRYAAVLLVTGAASG